MPRLTSLEWPEVNGSKAFLERGEYARQTCSLANDDQRKVVEMMSAYPGDQCVVQTLQEASPMPLAAAAATTPARSDSHCIGGQFLAALASSGGTAGQHQNIRDMDIIHVQWCDRQLRDCGGGVVATEHTYNHYLRHCGEHKLEPVNAASFGKLIRSVFLGLRTRRLGTRGNSKYHYYGIRVKPNSPLNQISEEVTTTALRQQSATQAKSFSDVNAGASAPTRFPLLSLQRLP
ncbi:hypothetical protein HPB52_024797 [Rhipicephalus sanguineus]|uniref:RFX-type winged-helix domain-containing protein n=1 Tax=Rhipicephalus sanguineus TaxID=34632 RepID=A0A9D4TDT3_RHISA|nr:hypothetical protein HPB52_024797 [Rhipicephalus sanguineus]